MFLGGDSAVSDTVREVGLEGWRCDGINHYVREHKSVRQRAR